MVTKLQALPEFFFVERLGKREFWQSTPWRVTAISRTGRFVGWQHVCRDNYTVVFMGKVVAHCNEDDNSELLVLARGETYILPDRVAKPVFRPDPYAYARLLWWRRDRDESPATVKEVLIRDLLEKFPITEMAAYEAVRRAAMAAK